MVSEKVKRFRENLAKDPDYYSPEKVKAWLKARFTELKERNPEAYQRARDMWYQNPPGIEDQAVLLDAIADSKDPESEKIFRELYRELSGMVAELLMAAD